MRVSEVCSLFDLLVGGVVEGALAMLLPEPLDALAAQAAAQVRHLVHLPYLLLLLLLRRCPALQWLLLSAHVWAMEATVGLSVAVRGVLAAAAVGVDRRHDPD